MRDRQAGKHQATSHKCAPLKLGAWSFPEAWCLVLEAFSFPGAWCLKLSPSVASWSFAGSVIFRLAPTATPVLPAGLNGSRNPSSPSARWNRRGRKLETDFRVNVSQLQVAGHVDEMRRWERGESRGQPEALL